MRWIARVLVFTTALIAGIFSALFFLNIGGGGLSNCVIRFEPQPPFQAEAPKGVRVMYAGWKYENDDRIATLRLVIHNGLNESVIYRGYTTRDALPEVRVDGRKFERWRCLNGVEDFEILPGRSAEIYVDRWEFPANVESNAKVTIGLYFYLGANSEKPEILAVSEPIELPAIFRAPHFEPLSKNVKTP